MAYKVSSTSRLCHRVSIIAVCPCLYIYIYVCPSLHIIDRYSDGQSMGTNHFPRNRPESTKASWDYNYSTRANDGAPPIKLSLPAGNLLPYEDQ